MTSKMLGRFIAVLTVALSSQLVCAADAPVDKMLAEADSAYSAGEYSEAVRIYGDVASRQGTSASLLVNLGNAYVKSGDLGRGRLAYERALLENPGEKEARNNIDYIETRVSDNNRAEAKGSKVSVSPESESFFSMMKTYVTRRHTSDAWAWWGASFFILAILCLALYLFSSEVVIRKIGFFAGIGAGVLCVIAMVCAFSAASALENNDEGVITAYKVNLLDSPDENGKKSKYPLTRGTLMKVLDEERDDAGKVMWYKVRLNSDFVGWIRPADFETVAM